MYDDPERYEHDGFYEDSDYEDEYEADDSDYIAVDEENENVLWDDEEEAADNLPEKKRRKRKNQVVLADSDTDSEETELSEQAMWQITKEEQLIEELEADAEEHPFEDGTDEEEPERKKLKRELRAEALVRLEDSARTQGDFENVIAWWDRLDANRERRERYHELSRSGDDVPLDYGASANELFFPDTLNDVLEKQLRKGDFIDAIFYCPYDIHEVVTEEYLSKILWELNEGNTRSCSFSALSGCSVLQESLKYGIKATGTSARCVAQCSKRYEKSCSPHFWIRQKSSSQ